MTSISSETVDRALVDRLIRQQDAMIAIGRLWQRYEGDFVALVRETVEVAAHTLDFERVSMWRYSHDARSILCENLYEVTSACHSAGAVLDAERYPAYFAAMESEEVMSAEDAIHDPQTAEFSDTYLKPQGIGAMLDVPIRAEGGLYGVLCHEHVGNPRLFYPDEINTATYLANMIGAAVEFGQRLEHDQRIKELLRDEATTWRVFFEQSRDGIVVLDQNAGVHDINQRYADMLGYPMDEARALHVWDWDVGHTRHELLKMIRKVSSAGDHFETTQRRKDGTLIDVAISSNGATYKDRKLVFCIVRDITRRKKAEEELRLREELMRRIASQMPGAIFQFRLKPNGDRGFTFLSDGAMKLGGMTKDEWSGSTRSIFSLILPEDAARVESAIERSAETLGALHEDFRICHRDGSVHWVEARSSPQMEADGSIVWHGLILDVTSRKVAEEEVHLLATTDSLTACVNRREFTRLMEQEAERIKRYGGTMGLIMYDLDRFKQVNDSFGHETGDYVLQTVAGLVRDNIRAVDVAGRWGGEEFMIMLPQSGLAGAREMAEKLREIIEQHRFDKVGSITASFGASEFSSNDQITSLLRRVDKALYLAKNNGRNRVETVMK